MGYEDGFYFRSQDGKHEIKLEGLFQFGGNFFQANRGRTSEFDLRRMRPELAGRFAKVYLFKIEPKFSEDEVELEEAWIGADLFEGKARLMLGRMKAPFNLEEVRSRRHIDFPRFSILNQFAPAEDHGIFLNGKLSDNLIEYGVAIYNGTGESDTTSSKDVAVRIMLHPFVAEENSALRNLQVGLAATFGEQDQSVAGASIVNAAGQPVIDFSADTRLSGDRSRLGLEFAVYDGPFMLQSEFLLQRQEMQSGGSRQTIQFHGAYVTVSLVLTGEAKSFSGVTPKDPVDLENGTGSGAWILALRLSQLRSDSQLRDLGFVAANRFARSIRSISLGLNWVLNEHLILRNTFVQSFYSDDVLLGNRRHEREAALMIELQLHF